MILNLKVLGLALVAVFAMSAVAASMAAAQQGTLTSTGPVTLIGTENEGAGKVNALTGFGFTVTCPGSTLTGHKVLTHEETTAGKKHEAIPVPATTITLTPHYKQTNATGDANCRVNPGNFPLTIDMNECDYVAHIGVTTGGVPHTYGITFDIVCPPNKEITLTVWTNDTKHTTEPTKPFCKMHFGSQAGLAGAHITDNTNGTLTVAGTIEKIKAKKTNGGEDPLLCAAAETTTAQFDVDGTIKGQTPGGAATAISLSHP